MSEKLDELVRVVRALRDPACGCPWDLEQDFQTLATGTLEEVYELIEALENNDPAHIREELGDVLLHIILYAQIASEKELFSLDDVASCEAEKMVSRHPHVFGDRAGVKTATDVLQNWENDKAQKRASSGTLEDVSRALPALIRAQKLQKRAMHVGFNWPNLDGVMDKVREELDELSHESKTQASVERLESELGDVLFSAICLASFLKLDAEKALRATNARFEQRFAFMEKALRDQGKDIQSVSFEERESLWARAKQAANDSSPA
ncbi:MAG: nucleoside triphosphate pyrophosphohydrolase [Alphaproteobacteria bacterium]|nr:nucleoside triphosphate pyrophosphohydrolase [Alphaproteobacteria bacterium]